MIKKSSIVKIGCADCEKLQEIAECLEREALYDRIFNLTLCDNHLGDNYARQKKSVKRRPENTLTNS